MSNIVLTEKEIKILLINSLKQAGVEIEDIVFKQKVQLFGKDRGFEINAELVKKQAESEISALLNKLTYQNTNQFIPVPAQPQQPQQQVQQPFSQQTQQSYTFEQPFVAE